MAMTDIYSILETQKNLLRLLDDIRGWFDYDKLKLELAEIEILLSKEDIWSDKNRLFELQRDQKVKNSLCTKLTKLIQI